MRQKTKQPPRAGWSDIYSVGATLYTCIAGTPPQAADARMEKDRLIPRRTLARETYSDELYSIVDACLELDHLKRPQTAFELQKLLMLDAQIALEAYRGGLLHEDLPETTPTLYELIEQIR